jgi:hypothetical protein
MAAILGPHRALHMIKIKNGGVVRATDGAARRALQEAMDSFYANLEVPKLAPQPQL